MVLTCSDKIGVRCSMRTNGVCGNLTGFLSAVVGFYQTAFFRMAGRTQERNEATVVRLKFRKSGFSH